MSLTVPRPLPEGFGVADRDDTEHDVARGAAFVLGAGLVLAFCAGLTLDAAWSGELGSAVVTFALFLGPLMAVATSIGIWGLVKIAEGWLAYPAELVVPRWPLQAGEAVALVYRRRLRRPLRTSGKAEVHLQLRRTVRGPGGVSRTVALPAFPLGGFDLDVRGFELSGTLALRLPDRAEITKHADLKPGEALGELVWDLHLVQAFKTGSVDSDFTLAVALGDAAAAMAGDPVTAA